MDRTEKSSTSVVTKEKKESRRKSMTSNDANSKNDKKEYVLNVEIELCALYETPKVLPLKYLTSKIEFK